jgi:hypothetical protein
MPRLPDFNDLGARPIPQSRRGIASNPRAGAVGDALAGFGGRVQQLGERGLQQAREKEDKLAYASARASLLSADIETRRELENDGDFESWEARYDERMGKAREAAAGLIRSSGDRSLFESEAKVDVLRGRAAVSNTVDARRRDGRLATMDTGLATLEEVGLSAPDEATREAALLSAGEMIDGAVERGDITAVAGVERKRKVAEQYTVGRVETMLLADDFDGAKAFVDLNRGRLDAATETDLLRRIDNGLDNRLTLTRAEDAVHGARVATIPTGDEPALSVAGERGEVAEVLGAAGYPAHVVAGFLGNFEVEGGYGGARGDGGTASGIAQWRHERRDNFRRMFGKDPHEAGKAEQAQFVVWEMENPQQAGMSVAQRDAILAAETPEQAAELIDRHYERSSGAHRARRQEAARGFHGGTQSPQKHNLNDVYAGIDARAAEEGWTPEETESVKAQAARIVARDENLLAREQGDAADEAAQVIASLPQGLTNIGQIPRSVRERMDPVAVAQLEQGIRERQQAANEEAREAAQEKRAAELEYMRRFLPQEYARLDPLKETGALAPAAYNKFLMDWTEARKGRPPAQTEIDAGIRNEIAFQERTNGGTYDDEKKVRLATGMEAQLGLIRERKGFITAADYADAFRTMTREVDGGWLSRDRAAFEVLEVPAAEAARIRNAWTGSKPPTDAQILQAWMELRGG